MRSFHKFFLVLVLAANLFSLELHAQIIRIASANITSGKKQSYDLGHGIRIFKAAKPDIVAIQEMNYGDNSPRAFDEFIDNAFGVEFHYYRESSHKKNYRIPNGIISRYPIQEAGTWESPLMPDRGYAWAKLELPSLEPLWVISVHLSSKSATNRKIEAEAIVELIQKNIPTGAHIVIAGDFNTKSDKEFCLTEFGKVMADAKAPRGFEGKAETNANRNKRYDWVLASPSLEEHHVPLEMYISGQLLTFPHGLVFDTRTLTPLPRPALIDDSAAPEMQHMLVLRDFEILGD